MFRPYLYKRRQEAETQAVVAAMTAAGATPSADYQAIINSTIRAMKSSGRWNDLYRFRHFAAPIEAQALICWKSRATLTKAGTVAHAANQGFTAAGTTADALQDTFNPSTASVGTDDVAVSMYSRTNQALSTRTDWGGTAASYLGRTRITGDTGQFRLNMSAAVSLPASVTDTSGLWSWLRNAANVAQVCQNGVQVGADITVTSQGAPNVTFNWCNGVVGTFSSATKQMALGVVSKKRTVAQELAFYTDEILPLLRWNGANV